MGDRDYKVVYKSRVLDRDEPRPHIPTALDPYDQPYISRSRSRRGPSTRDSTSTIETNSSTTETGRSPTRLSQSKYKAERSRENVVEDRRSAVFDNSRRDSEIEDRRSVITDQRRREPQPQRSDASSDARSSHSRRYADIDVGTSSGRGRQYHIDDRSRAYEGAYVIDARQGEIIDVTVPSRGRDQLYEKDDRRVIYDEPRPLREVVYDRASERERDREKHYDSYVRPVDGNKVLIVDRDEPSSRSRFDEDEYRSSRRTTNDYERGDDDWRLVDSMRDTKIDNNQSRASYAGTQPRSRAQTYSSEDSYVMVSPSQAPKSTLSSTPRSAIARNDYDAPELRRRRSRSISFRDTEVHKHDASERKHERPGAEAEICGQYLRQRPAESDYDDRSDSYASNHRDSRSDYRSRDVNEFASTYRERDGPYAPQMDHAPNRRRERSRHRRREDDADNESYYSKNVTTKKTTRETRY